MSEPDDGAALSGPRDRFIPLRKSDILDGVIAHFGLNDDRARQLRQFAQMLGAILHHQYFTELDRLRQTYFYFDPELRPPGHLSAESLESAYRDLREEFVRVLTEANFVEIGHEEILRAFAEHALVRVKVKVPLGDYRDVRMFRRGYHRETVSIPSLFGLRRRSVEVEVYDDVVLMVATRPDIAGAEPRLSLLSARRSTTKARGGAVLFKYFRHIPRWDLEALFPNVRVVMGIRDQLTLGVPALVGGVPILLKLASTLTVLFVVAGFYLGLSGKLHDNDAEQALAAISGLFALGAFVLRQWSNFHRQSLIHQKQLTDNIYYRNVNNNSGIFNYLIGEAEEQDWKEALLAYCSLLAPPASLSRDEVKLRAEDFVMQRFGLQITFGVDDALARLTSLGLLRKDGNHLAVLPLADALTGLERNWGALLRT